MAGTCDPTTGQCSNPIAANGTACNDGNACDLNDSCQAGVCTAGSQVVCGASDQCHVAGTCDPTSGLCSNPPAPNGTTCNDGNACDLADTCQAGVCTAGSHVACSASDQCHVAGTCNPATGQCSNPTAPNGTGCNDGNACDLNDSCQSGVCTAGSHVSCTASDQCHAAGTCNPSTGQCSNPTAANGTACNDGNACDLSDTCQSGVCTAGSHVTCSASDQCHVAGTCNPSTGQCSNPAAANGTACNDGNACDLNDTCQSGVCAAGSHVTCTASDQCHVAGTCDPSTGQCSNPAAANGTACNDGNACDLSDTCQSGACTAGSHVTCSASDQCHVAGTCNPSTGQCSNPAAANGTACSDGNACDLNDTCQSGACTAGSHVTCTASDQCHTAGTCDPTTGQCSNPSAANGTSCTGTNPCYQTYSCQSGSCSGSNPVTCTASDQCHVAGTCDPTTGTCSNPAASNGTACNDGNPCDVNDTCQSGTCTAGGQVTCTAEDQCHQAGTCDPTTGQCSNPTIADGTSCTGSNLCDQSYACVGGTCTGSNPVTCAPPGPCQTGGGCDPTTGQCTYAPAPDGSACSTGNLCLTGQTCLSGACTGGSPVTCTASQCQTPGTCNPATGACSASTPVADNTPCNANDQCTTNDICRSGTCVPGQSIDLNDSDPCTIDTCDPVNGVVHHACSTNDQTVATNSADSNAWLYTGSNPVQTGVAPGTIAPGTAALIRGNVVAKDGTILPAVTVTAVGHPELGSTITDGNGNFSMAVNSATLRLHFALTNYLPAERILSVQPGGSANADSVVLIRTDTAVDTLQTDGTSTGYQVHRATPSTDSSGTRTATILVPPSTQATMTLANGTTQPLTSVSLRATEFTVGTNGPATMPAPLPPQSEYTYAVGVTADEALAAGATEVNFSQPLAFYVEDFLDFPAGTTMPLGYYDSTKGAWVAAPSGVCVTILSENGGSAQIDVTGSGTAATSAQLQAFGITDGELSELASMYAVGQSLWRVMLPHLTNYDLNPGWGPPDGGVPPPPPPPPPPPVPPCDQSGGSSIGCQTQALGEDLPVAGTPLTLHYASDRQAGRQATLDLPLSGPNGPGPAQDIQLQVQVAGNTFTEQFPPQPNLSTTFAWNRKDAFGRITQGEQLAKVTVSNQYIGTYESTPTFGFYGNHVPIPGQPSTRQLISLQASIDSFMGGWDAKPEGFGGWDFSIHHVYDPVGRIIYFGDGTDSFQPDIIKTIAGGGLPSIGLGTGPALYADLGFLSAVVVAPDSSFYVFTAGCIRWVDPGGTIHPFAGTCFHYGTSGDGGPASSALLGSVLTDGALGADGSLYIVDEDDHVVRKIDPQGIIHTVAGNGTAGFSGDGGPGAQATLNHPSGVDVTPDGTLFIADQSNYRVRRVGPDGIITTVAGNGNGSGDSVPCPGYFSCENIPAIDAALSYVQKVRAAADGGFYLLIQNANKVRRVTPDGIIYTYVGTTGNFGTTVGSLSGPADIGVGQDGRLFILDLQGSSVRQVDPAGTSISTVVDMSGACGFSGDNGPAGAATICAPEAGFRIGSNDTIYIADGNNNRIRLVGTPLPAFAGDGAAYTFGSQDGRQAYLFDGTGKHVKTIDALTQATLYQFGYTNGLLSSITDVNGDVTTIVRDGAGNLTSITGPFGGQTNFTTDSNGYLASATDPASQVTQYTYDSGGLMQNRTDARGGLYQYAYDSYGRLTEDQDPAGGYKILNRTILPNGGWNVSITTALGRQSTYQSTLPAAGAITRTNTFPDGLSSSWQFTPDGVAATTVPDRTQTTTSQQPDPLFGILSPVVSTTTTTPSGLKLVQNVSRSATYGSGGALATLTETRSVNGANWTNVFNTSNLTWTMTSPAGRQTVTTVDSAGRPVQIATPNVTPIALSYDSHGRLVATAQGPSTWKTGYDAMGFLASQTDALGNTVSFVNDNVGRPARTVLADGRLVLTSYDGDSNVTSITLPQSETHDFSFTPVDQLLEYSPPSLGQGTWDTSYGYDLDHDLQSMLRPDGVSVGYGYDSAGRLLSTTYPQGTLSGTYSSTSGLLTALSSPSGEQLAYSYDGFLRTGVTWSGPVAGNLTLGFDNNFRVTSQSVNGSPLSFGYDADGLMNQAGSMAIALDPSNGRITGTTLGSITDAYTYDSNGRFASYTAQYSGSTLYSESVQRDLDGRITQKTETVASTTHVWGYSYDVNGRLTDVTEDGQFGSHYGYDADDNRTTYTNTQGTISPTYDAQDRLLTYGSASYAYTADGELTSKTDGSGTTGYTYDALGNLLGVSLPGGTSLSYVVDGENRRVGKQVAGTLTQGFLYKDALNVVVQLDGSGNVVSRFVFGSKPNVPDYFTSSAGTFRILSDHLGSPRLIVNTATGGVAQEIDYDEFGNVTNDTSPGLTPFGFAGGLYDKDTGLVRFGARDYDPSVGRWTSKDPIRFAGGMNLYGYVVNDPVNGLDPQGTDPWWCNIPFIGLIYCGPYRGTNPIPSPTPTCTEPDCMNFPPPGPPEPPPAPICAEPKNSSKTCTCFCYRETSTVRYANQTRSSCASLCGADPWSCN